MVCHQPDQVLRARSALRFTQSVLQSGHGLDSVYFYQSAAAMGLKSTLVSSDDYDPQQQWQSLASTYGIALQICVGSAQRRGVVDKTLAQGFEITGLGQWIAAVGRADRVLRFP